MPNCLFTPALLFTLALVCAARELKGVDRALLCRDGVCASCQAQRFMNWPGYDMLFKPLQTDNPQTCCDACKERYGCRGWLLNTDRQECYLKEDVGFPAPCAACIGGILDGANDTVCAMLRACAGDPYSQLNACRAWGRACANRAAQGACQEVRNACNIGPSKNEIIEYPYDLDDVKDFPTKEERQICRFYVRETCKWTAGEAARMIDSECHRIALERGPAWRMSGCSSKNQAESMFRAVADAICESSV